MSHAFTLHLPVEHPYRGLAADVAARFAETVGGSSAEAQAFGVEVAAGVESVAASGEAIDLVFDRAHLGVEVAIRCGPELRLIRHVLPAIKK
ncbi:MAG: hypothetical protein ABI051_06630 [Vicinamibacterales bacterium]